MTSQRALEVARTSPAEEVVSTTLASEGSPSTSEAEEEASDLSALAAFLMGIVLDRFEEAGAEVDGAAPGT